MNGYNLFDGEKEVSASQSGTHVVTSAQATAEIVILTLDDLPALSIYITQVFRAGVKIADDAAYTVSGNVLTITEEASSPTWVMTAGDILMFHVAGRVVE